MASQKGVMTSSTGSYTYSNRQASVASACKSSKTGGGGGGKGLAKPWSFSTAEGRWKRRVASYKLLTVEGRVKASVCKSIRWIKNKCFEMRYGHW